MAAGWRINRGRGEVLQREDYLAKAVTAASSATTSSGVGQHVVGLGYAVMAVGCSSLQGRHSDGLCRRRSDGSREHRLPRRLHSRGHDGRSSGWQRTRGRSWGRGLAQVGRRGWGAAITGNGAVGAAATAVVVVAAMLATTGVPALCSSATRAAGRAAPGGESRARPVPTAVTRPTTTARPGVDPEPARCGAPWQPPPAARGLPSDDDNLAVVVLRTAYGPARYGNRVGP